MDEQRPSGLEPKLVEEFVGNAHGNLARVTELLDAQSALVNACWDWGGGDWETALGAASHMGRRDIAEFLLGRGARMDIYAAAMLGFLDVVKAIIAADPDAKNKPGPHGIPLLVHAEAGGDAARPVVEYLQSIGQK